MIVDEMGWASGGLLSVCSVPWVSQEVGGWGERGSRSNRVATSTLASFPPASSSALATHQLG